MRAYKALASLAGNYCHGEIVASHQHAEGQLVYAINGVMLVSVVGTTWKKESLCTGLFLQQIDCNTPA